MLTDGFKWAPRWQYDRRANGLYLHGVLVAYVDARTDGRWLARLDCQQSISAPLVLRECQSMETGRRGCERWAARHEARLRREVAAIVGGRAKHCGTG